MKLTNFDISDVDNRNSEKKNAKDEDDEEEKDLEEEWEGYNPNFTLRKCCSRLMENLSTLFPHLLFEIIKPVLENEMQHSEWIIKERSILALGAIANGAYSSLKPHLPVLIPFLIRELQHPHKLVRAISCWTLSRFSKFILIDNNCDSSEIVFKEYLIEILKKFFDKESIVQEAGCSALSAMIMTDKEKLEPYLFDIFKVITEVFDQYTGTSLLTLYDIISLVTENYEEHFKNPNLIGKLVNCVVNKWYDLIKSGDCKNISPIFEMVCSIIKVSSNLAQQFFDFFYNGCLIIIESNLNLLKKHNDSSYIDKELLSKSLDLISVLCRYYPSLIKDNHNKSTMLDYLLNLIELNDNYVKHYLLALLGDLAKVDSKLLSNKFENLMNFLLSCLDLPENRVEGIDYEKLSTCNNACWAIGLIAVNYPNQIKNNVLIILKRLLKIMSLPKVIYYNIVKQISSTKYIYLYRQIGSY
jgi:transportin-1